MEQKYAFSDIKEYLKNLSPLRFHNLTKDDLKEKNPRDFLNAFFRYNREYNTIYGNGKLQTNAGCRRSIGDIFRITFYYFPKVRLTTIYKTLLTMVGESHCLSSICLATGLRVYRATKEGEKAYFNGEKIDEFTTDFNQFEELANCKSLGGAWGESYGADNIKFINVK